MLLRGFRNKNFLVVFFPLWFFAIPLLVFAGDGPYKVTSIITSYKSEHGRSISEKEFFDITGSPNAGVGVGDMMKLWTEFGKVQVPPISKKDLLSIVKTSRGALADIRYKYTFHLTPVDSSHVISEKYEVGRYAISNEKVLFSVENNLKNDGYINKTMSFDGAVVRHVDFASTTPFASIDSYSHAGGTFFPSQSLLSVSSMLDTKRYYGALNAYSDFVGMLEDDETIVLEELESISGEACIVVTNGNYRMYVSPQKNFSIVCKECWVRYSLPGDRELISKAELKDFHEYDNSLWLPRKYYEEFFSKGKLVSTILVEFDDVIVNSKIPDVFFQDIIPENSLVADGVNNLLYTQSDSPSINALLKSVAKSKRQWFWRIASMTTGIILIIIWIIIKYVKYRATLASK
jgi:hypothetical protein